MATGRQPYDPGEESIFAMKMRPLPRKTFGRSLCKICERLDLPFVKARHRKIHTKPARKRK
jgi:hypothetical protein